jgi:endonuclease YncB( thermonuclease family)
LFTFILAAASLTLSGQAQVTDGDSLRVGQQRVRLFGVDAPELSQRCGQGSASVACGKMSAAWLAARIDGRHVDCTPMDRDRYDRVVAICRSGGTDLNAAIVEAGWATAYRRYSMAYVSAEGRAKSSRKGIWALGFTDPSVYRQEQRASLPAQIPPNPRCVIKGNINSKGRRLYHLPQARSYPDVRINVSRGERWFCSVSEATMAGWRAAS